MAYNIHVSIGAQQDVYHAIAYYSRINPLLGDRFLQELLDTYRKLEENPQFYGYVSINPIDKFRDVKMKSFPYNIVYEIHLNNVFISAVFNNYRNPLAKG